MKRILDIVILLLLLLLICVNRDSFFGIDLHRDNNTDTQSIQNVSSEVSIDEAKRIFSSAVSLGKPNDGVYEVMGTSEILGYIMKSTPYSNRIAGFMGPTPLLIALDKDRRVLKVMPLPNKESQHYFSIATSYGLLDEWTGLTTQEAADKHIDAVTGATYSSRSVIGSMQARMRAIDNESLQSHNTDTDWKSVFRDLLLIILICVSLVAYFMPSRIMKWRNLLLAASILILGIWQGRILSMAQFTTWVFAGIPFAVQWIIVLIFLLSILLPLIFGKAYYCSWLCPMGAAQSLLGELNKKHKLKLNVKLVQWLTVLRSAILFGGLLTIGIGLSFDFADYEAFAIFRPQSASIAALVIGGISLIISIWIPRPWCRFLCPFGEMLEIVRRKKTQAGDNK